MLLLQPVVGVASKGKPKREPPSPLKLYDVNIVTAEPDNGRLRVWGYTGGDPAYENIWAAESVHYDSVAIGDADNDGEREIIGTTRCKVTEGKGKTGTSWYEIFFDVYKEDISGVWKSSEGIKEDWIFWSNEVTIADVDGESGNEVVMITPRWLVVYKYFEEAFKITSSRDSFVEGHTLGLESVAVGDVDGDGFNEILVSANERGVENQGYLLIFQDATLDNFVVVPIDAQLGDQSLRVGDLDNDGCAEICSPGYRKVGDLYHTYIFVWKYEFTQDGWNLIVEEKIFELDDWPWMHLDVGNLVSDDVDEIVLTTGPDPDQLILYNLDEGRLSEIQRKTLDYYDVIVNNVYVADSNGDGQNEIVVGGGGRTDRSSGCFYLEVFDENIETEWQRLGGERKEFSVWYAAIG